MADNDQHEGGTPAEHNRTHADIDTSKPSVSRVYDFMLGGKDNFAVDRQVAEAALRIAPDAPAAARSNRAFLRRVVRHLAGEAGVRQFLDIGSGLPTQGNVHEVAQQIAPDARVVYVDNDPIVLAHGRALLAKNGGTTVVEADIRAPEAIIDHPAVRSLIDFEQPVGLLLFGILHHLHDDEEPEAIAARLRAALPSGSYVALSHFHNPGPDMPEVSEQATAAEKLFNEHLGTGRWRTRDEILAYFGDLQLLEPGLVPLAEWRPDPGEPVERGITYHTFVGGVAHKP
ncbi:SAM-dependent methyltransferase [Microbispora rosea subsp. aerata]|nr:SAM-dependent methyltransferase [Microbispora rosea]GGO12631.1 SAM-dependent methyltransferase [Microbispora rosea subsp. aerata]GIH54100.1 SAM-dependent methyltransferase [Microbispora rosea subsp. aerata]GLJ85073.1 SAM-dependent methyltransferase [Microbispora rosea subsp. aerata]